MRSSILYILFGILCCSSAVIAKKKAKEGRVFSLFNVVTFKNNQCTGSSSTSSNRVMGTCLSSSECSDKGDSTADGNCASGFGVCCVITLSGSSNTIYENCTYVQNPGYPSAYTTTSSTITTTITRSSDYNLCQIRLDFENFVTSISSTGVCGTAADTFTVTAPFSSSTSSFPPTVCGTLTGQHMYYETGTTGNPTFSIATGTGSSDRTWRIKVNYIECGSTMRAPVGCDQYFTGSTGIVESYGFDGSMQIATMRSNYCVRQESGYCTINWGVNQGVTDGFYLAPPSTIAVTAPPSPAIPIATLTVDTNIITGGIFSSTSASTLDGIVTGSILPFKLYHYSGASIPSGVTGFSLMYTQVPC